MAVRKIDHALVVVVVTTSNLRQTVLSHHKYLHNYAESPAKNKREAHDPRKHNADDAFQLHHVVVLINHGT
jgi:hypothetical protein